MNITATFRRVKNGKFVSCSEMFVENLCKKTANSIVSKLANGPGRDNTNVIIEIKNEENKMDEWVWEIDGEKYLIRIRKLTPKECFRLMGFTDADFEKAEEANSNTQLYKQAGNSIVVPVLERLLGNIFKQDGTLLWE